MQAATLRGLPGPRTMWRTGVRQPIGGHLTGLRLIQPCIMRPLREVSNCRRSARTAWQRPMKGKIANSPHWTTHWPPLRRNRAPPSPPLPQRVADWVQSRSVACLTDLLATSVVSSGAGTPTYAPSARRVHTQQQSVPDSQAVQVWLALKPHPQGRAVVPLPRSYKQS